VRKLKIYRNIKRYRRIITTFAKYGFEDIVGRLRVEFLFRFGRKLIRKREKRRILQKSLAERLRLAFEELGTTFVKLGQILSLRPDIIPEDFARELSKLQDRVAPFSHQEAREIVESELNSPVEELFTFFSEEPIAAASIAQVQKGVTKKGERVAVKIQRPGIQETIETDLAILFDLATLAEQRVPSLKLYNPVKLVDEFATNIRRELDFNREARSIELFRRNFEGDGTVYIPKVYWDLTTENVLTIELIDGIKVSEKEKLLEAGFDLETIAANGARLVLRQIFEHGFFHADPHPGNIFIIEDSVIVPLDYGLVGYIGDEMREKIAAALMALANRDVNRMTRVFLDMGVVDQTDDLAGFREDLKGFVDTYYNVPLEQINLGRALLEMIGLVRRHSLRIPTDFAVMAKAIITVEALGRELCPDFQMMSIAEPFVRELYLKQFEPKKNIKQLLEAAYDYGSLLRMMPSELASILTKINSGTLEVQFEARGMRQLVTELDRSSNRLSFSVIIAGILVGSSLIVNLKVGPLLFGLPVIGLVGYFTAGVLGVWLLIAIMRSGRL
jgi:ubiquinone biosynthesis protein